MSADTPDILLDLLTGVSVSDPASPDEALLVLLVGVLTPSDLLGVASLSGVICLGRAETFSGVVAELDSTSSLLRSTFLLDLLALLGVSTFGLSTTVVAS